MSLPTATEIAAAVNTGAQSARDVIAAACQRADADVTGAIIRVHAERAAAAAADVDQRIAAGETLPLAGVPVVLKDNLCCEGLPTTACSRILEGFIAPYTATAVARLEAAGAVVIASANMDEFAMGSSNETSVFGPVRNPHDSTRIPGGSSGGSAAAVAAGIAPLALGSDTGGSIRQPAALCGAVGFKPSYGRISRYGLLAFGSSLDQIGPLTSTVADADLALQIMAGYDPLDSTVVDRPVAPVAEPADLTGLRVGIVESHRDGCDPAVAAALDQQLDKLRAAGANIVPVALPHEQHAVATYYIIATGEASSNLSRYDGVHYGRRAAEAESLDDVYRRSRGEGFGDEVKRRILLGTYVLSSGYQDAYYRHAMKVRALIKRDLEQAFEQCDVIVGPTSPTTAFELGAKTADPLQMYLSDIYTIAANLAGIPAISLPAGSDDAGLPIGVHLQAPAFADDRLLGIAKAMEALEAQPAS